MLPAALTAALAGMLVLELALAGSDAPRDEGGASVTRPQFGAVPQIAMVAAEPVIRERPIFAPGRVAGEASAADPLGGAQVSGAWAIGRQANLVLRDSSGAIHTLRVGQAVNQWVLASVTTDGARFSRDGKTITVPFGATAPPVADATQNDEQSQ